MSHAFAAKDLVNKFSVPQFKVEQLKDLQVIIFAAGEVGFHYPLDLGRPEESALFHGLFREKILNQWTQRPTQP